jgi:two-component system OmpR family sensor kinase
MLDSIRIRLTMWYVGIFALLLMSFSAVVYTVLWNKFLERADGVLRSISSATISILDKELSENGLDELAARDTVKALNFPEHTLAIFDGSGELLAERPPGSHELIPISELKAGTDGESRVFTREQRRVVLTRVTLAPMRRQYEIVVSRSLTPLLGELAADRKFLFIAVPLGALLAGITGWFLARKSLAPVLAMSAQAHRIGVKNLDERLPVVNPRDELGKLAATFNDLLSRVTGAFEAQRRFMADASHELRTPISVVRTTASVTLSKDHRDEEEYRNAVTIVEAQARRLSRIVEDMLRLARADSGHFTLQPRRFPMDDTLLETAQTAIVLASSKRIRIAIDDVPEAPFYGDEDLLRQMMLNLVDNAVKYTPEGGEIRLSLTIADASYLIRVSDNGPGIPADAQPFIFDRFYRVDKAYSPGQGAGVGLGLAIARWIAEIHGGTLRLESSDQNGSSFVVVLPAEERGSLAGPVEERTSSPHVVTPR